MIHSVNIKTEFKNIGNLLNQFTKKGWSIVMDQKCTTYYSDPSRDRVHTYVAKNPTAGGYDIGINKDEHGNAFFVCDFFDGSIERQLGKDLQHIKQGYALDELREFIEQENLAYNIKTLETGEMVITAEG